MNKIILTIILCLMVFAVAIYYQHKVDQTNWWTKVFCANEVGELYTITNLFNQYHKCIIDNEEYRAYFGKESRYRSNLTNSKYFIWTLENIRDSKQRSKK